MYVFPSMHSELNCRVDWPDWWWPEWSDRSKNSVENMSFLLEILLCTNCRLTGWRMQNGIFEVLVSAHFPFATSTPQLGYVGCRMQNHGVTISTFPIPQVKFFASSIFMGWLSVVDLFLMWDVGCQKWDHKFSNFSPHKSGFTHHLFFWVDSEPLI